MRGSSDLLCVFHFLLVVTSCHNFVSMSLGVTVNFPLLFTVDNCLDKSITSKVFSSTKDRFIREEKGPFPPFHKHNKIYRPTATCTKVSSRELRLPIFGVRTPKRVKKVWVSECWWKPRAPNWRQRDWGQILSSPKYSSLTTPFTLVPIPTPSSKAWPFVVSHGYDFSFFS